MVRLDLCLVRLIILYDMSPCQFHLHSMKINVIATDFLQCFTDIIQVLGTGLESFQFCICHSHSTKTAVSNNYVRTYLEKICSIIQNPMPKGL